MGMNVKPGILAEILYSFTKSPNPNKSFMIYTYKRQLVFTNKHLPSFNIILLPIQTINYQVKKESYYKFARN